MAINIVAADLDDPLLIDLLHHHQKTALANTPGGKGHSLNIAALRADGIHVFAAYNGPTPVGSIALKQHDEHLGEIKSMYVVTNMRGRGIADMLMDQLETKARDIGLNDIKLETHPGSYFMPAINFYQRRGYRPCGPFANYDDVPESVFYGRKLG